MSEYMICNLAWTLYQCDISRINTSSKKGKLHALRIFLFVQHLLSLVLSSSEAIRLDLSPVKKFSIQDFNGPIVADQEFLHPGSVVHLNSCNCFYTLLHLLSSLTIVRKDKIETTLTLALFASHGACSERVKL